MSGHQEHLADVQTPRAFGRCLDTKGIWQISRHQGQLADVWTPRAVGKCPDTKSIWQISRHQGHLADVWTPRAVGRCLDTKSIWQISRQQGHLADVWTPRAVGRCLDTTGIWQKYRHQSQRHLATIQTSEQKDFCTEMQSTGKKWDPTYSAALGSYSPTWGALAITTGTYPVQWVPSAGPAAVSYTHLTLPTNAEV